MRKNCFDTITFSEQKKARFKIKPHFSFQHENLKEDNLNHMLKVSLKCVNKFTKKIQKKNAKMLHHIQNSEKKGKKFMNMLNVYSKETFISYLITTMMNESNDLLLQAFQYCQY